MKRIRVLLLVVIALLIGGCVDHSVDNSFYTLNDLEVVITSHEYELLYPDFPPAYQEPTEKTIIGYWYRNRMTWEYSIELINRHENYDPKDPYTFDLRAPDAFYNGIEEGGYALEYFKVYAYEPVHLDDARRDPNRFSVTEIYNEARTNNQLSALNFNGQTVEILFTEKYYFVKSEDTRVAYNIVESQAYFKHNDIVYLLDIALVGYADLTENEIREKTEGLMLEIINSMFL